MMKEKNLFGLIGKKLGHSLSPEIHEKIFEGLNIKGNYSLYELDENSVSKGIESFKLLGYKGVNVTIPYKEEVIKTLDYISEDAKNIGAVNTIAFKNGRVEGYNTDYYGFGMLLEENNIIVEDKKVVVLGNGGASKAVIQYLKDKKARDIYLVSRRCKESEEVDGVHIINYEILESLNGGDVIINCTPVGMYPNIEGTPVKERIIKEFSSAVDLIYNPMETEFLALGKKNGLNIANGLLMLVGQAVKAEEIWNDISIDKDTIMKVYEFLLNNFK